MLNWSGLQKKWRSTVKGKWVVLTACTIETTSPAWEEGIKILSARLGSRIDNLSQLSDFKLFKLIPQSGRYVKGFGRAFTLEGAGTQGMGVSHLRDGHKRRESVTT
ncbi:heme utilization protein HutZ [Marinobacterium iners]|nr:heme utilization protein HutZ [Marinobacterium iners]